MVKSLARLALCGLDKDIKERLREEANNWLDEIKDKKNQLRANNPKEWVEVSDSIKLQFAQLAGAEDFIIKFFNLSDSSERCSIKQKILKRGVLKK